MKFKCSCDFDLLEVDIKPLKLSPKEDCISFVIYEYRSGNTGKLYKKPKELGGVVLIGKEARKFLQYIIGRKK